MVWILGSDPELHGEKIYRDFRKPFFCFANICNTDFIHIYISFIFDEFPLGSYKIL